MKLLVGYDGSECAKDAIEDLRRAGLAATGVEALMLSVADVWAGEADADFARRYPDIAERARTRISEALTEARASADDARQRVQTLFPGWKVTADAIADSPYWGLVKRAQDWHADLIALGSQGRSMLGRAVFGSVSQNTVLYAQCSVRIGRCHADPSTRSDAPVRIAIGWDGSVDAMRAVSAVARRHWPAGSAARLITALDRRLQMVLAVGEPSSAAMPVADAEPSEGVVEGAGAAASELRSAGLDVLDPVTKAGDPKHVVVEEAAAWGADCIFVGAKGLSRIERVLLGSVSGAVAARAACSVEIVRG